MVRDLLLFGVGWPFRVVDGVRWRHRMAMLRRRLAAVGRNFVCDPVTSRFVTPSSIRFGDDCFVNAEAHFSGDIVVADRVMFGPRVSLLSGNHLYGIFGRHARFLRASIDNPEALEPIRIESDAWIGAGVIVLGGVTIAAGAVVGAGSVVTADVPPYTVVVGNPARPVRKIFDDTRLVEHLVSVGAPRGEADEIVMRRRMSVPATLPVIDHSEQDMDYFDRGQPVKRRQ